MYTVEEFDRQKSKVMNYILYKKRTKWEVRNKFSKTIDQEILNDIIEYVQNAGDLNDTLYIEKAINEFKALKNLSIKEIEYKLYSKGISKDDIEDYISRNYETLEEYESTSIKKIIEKKRELLDLEEIKLFLQRKGYKNSLIKRALEE